MNLIAISQRTQYISEYEETRDCLDQRWHEFLTSCQITPLLIPNHPKIVCEIIEENILQGVLLSGGNESPLRTETENLLLEYAIQKRLPVLGICHGMQMIQQYFGVKLRKITGHVIEDQEILIHGMPDRVNSFHNYGTTQTSCELTVWAKARDGVIKAIKHSHLPIMGMMWHPERCHPFKIRDIQFIKNFFSGERLQCGQLY